MRSFQSKIISLILLSVVLSAFIIGVIGINIISGVLQQNAEENMHLLCENQAEKLDTIFEKVEESVSTLSNHIIHELDGSGIIDNKEKRDNFIAKIEKNALNHVDSVGDATAIYIYFNPALTGEISGVFKLKQNNEFIDSELTDVTYYRPEDESRAAWWYEPVEKKRAVWLDVYHNDNVDMDIFSYIMPLFLHNQLIGVIGMDIPFSVLKKNVSKISVYETGFASVIDKNATVLYHRDLPFNFSLYEMKEEFGEVIPQLVNNDKTYSLISYTMNGERRNMSFCTLNNGMKFCIIAPEKEIYAKQIELTYNIIFFIALIVLITLIITLVFARKFTRPIKKLSYAARQMSEGNFNVDIDMAQKDEIGDLAVSLSHAREKLKDQIDLLYDEAHHDGLTGVSNKNAFQDVEAYINDKIKEGYYPFAVAVFDINKLKITNDVLGHKVGDELLRVIAKHFAKAFSVSNVYRIGGDEFVAVIKDDDFDDYQEMYNWVVENMPKLRIDSYPQLEVSSAYGIATYNPDTDTSFSDVFQRADKFMYENKVLRNREKQEWQKGVKGLRELQIDKYLEFLDIVNQNTEDFLFLYDIANDSVCFFGGINRRFGLKNREEGFCSKSDLFNIIHINDKKNVIADFDSVFAGEKAEHNMNYRLIDRDGRPVWINARGKVVFDDNGNSFIMIGRLSIKTLKHQYNLNSFLFNRNKLTGDIAEKRLPEYHSYVLMNIDNIVEYSFKFTDQQSDEMILKLAEVLEEILPLNRIYHIEYDRFVLLLDIKDNKEIVKLFDEINNRLDGAFTVSASVIPNNREFYSDENVAYDYVLQSLNENKDEQRSIVFVSKKELIDKIEEFDLFEELEESVKNNCSGFFLNFQPLIDSENLKIIAAECLLRYKSSVKGLVFPDKFIPILEKTGLINDVGLWVVENAIIKCVEWRRIIPGFKIAVNFSPVQLNHMGIVDGIIGLLKKYNLPGSALKAEITESAQLEDETTYTTIFSRLKEAGVCISIDDFGTGYSNLGYLKKIQADEIKIDRSFIKDIDESSYNFRVVSNLVEFAHDNDLKVVLEGVENEMEFAVVHSLKPECMQGYLFGKPCNSEEFERKYLDKSSVEYKEIAGKRESLLEVINKYHIVNFNPREILSQIDLGLWLVRYNVKSNQGELYADEIMKKLLDIDSECTPTEYYNKWFNNLPASSKDVIEELIKYMIVNNKVAQADFVWNHPERGELNVRCTCRILERNDDYIVFEGFYRNISDMGGAYTSI